MLGEELLVDATAGVHDETAASHGLEEEEEDADDDHDHDDDYDDDDINTRGAKRQRREKGKQKQKGKEKQSTEAAQVGNKRGKNFNNRIKGTKERAVDLNVVRSSSAIVKEEKQVLYYLLIPCLQILRKLAVNLVAKANVRDYSNSRLRNALLQLQTVLSCMPSSPSSSSAAAVTGGLSPMHWKIKPYNSIAFMVEQAKAEIAAIFSAGCWSTILPATLQHISLAPIHQLGGMSLLASMLPPSLPLPYPMDLLVRHQAAYLDKASNGGGGDDGDDASVKEDDEGEGGKLGDHILSQKKIEYAAKVRFRHIVQRCATHPLLFPPHKNNPTQARALRDIWKRQVIPQKDLLENLFVCVINTSCQPLYESTLQAFCRIIDLEYLVGQQLVGAVVRLLSAMVSKHLPSYFDVPCICRLLAAVMVISGQPSGKEILLRNETTIRILSRVMVPTTPPRALFIGLGIICVLCGVDERAAFCANPTVRYLCFNETEFSPPTYHVGNSYLYKSVDG